MNLTQNGSGTFTIGDGNSEDEFIAAGALLKVNTSDATAGAVSIYDTALGNGGGGEVTSVQPITLGTGTFSSGGNLLTLQAPGFVVTGDTALGSQELLLSGSGKSSLTGTLTLENNSGALDIPAGDQFTTGSSSSDGISITAVRRSTARSAAAAASPRPTTPARQSTRARRSRCRGSRSRTCRCSPTRTRR